jgi:lysophospholipase L1-like esterase
MLATRFTRSRGLLMAACLLISALLAPATRANADIAIKSGQQIAFLGDSITFLGWQKPGGYCKLVLSGLATNGINAGGINAGFPGDTSTKMLARLQRDVINKSPDWVTVDAGVNDVLLGAQGVALPDYETNMTAIVTQCQAANIKVILITPSPVWEAPGAPNTQMQGYVDFLKQLAQQKNCLLADANTAFQAVWKTKTNFSYNVYTVEGIHANPIGDMIFATSILQAMGLTDAQITTAKNVWLDMPNGGEVSVQYRDPAAAPAVPGQPKNVIRVTIPMTIRQFVALQAAANKQQSNVQLIANDIVAGDVRQLIKSGKYDSFDAIFTANAQTQVQTDVATQAGQQLTTQLAGTTTTASN